jgi:hypothetical protein
MSDTLERQLQALIEAPPSVATDPTFDTRVMHRITRIKRTRIATQTLAAAATVMLALLVTPTAMQAADAVNLLAARFVGALGPLLVSPASYVLALLAASAAVILHAATD